METLNVYSPKEYETKAEQLFSALPQNVKAGYGVFLPAKTNIFINDSSGKVDSLSFLAPIIATKGERYVEVWESDYLTTKLSDLLVSSLPDLSERTLYPLAGCGLIVANELQADLNARYNIDLPYAIDGDAQKPLVVDDVIKTGSTISRNIPRSVIANPDTVYAAWAAPVLSETDLLTNERYQPLKTLLTQKQKMLTSVIYAGAGVSPLGLPVNSISSIMPLFSEFGGDEYWQPTGTARQKALAVTSSLNAKYFGEGIIDIAIESGLKKWFEGMYLSDQS